MTGGVLVARHGEPDYEAVRSIGVDSSARNVAPLTAAGIEQARRRGQALRSYRVVRVVSSPMTRAFQTAVLIAQELSLGVDIDVELREWDSGTDGSEAAFADAAAEFRDARGAHAAGRRQMWEAGSQLVARASAAVARWRDEERDVVIVTHAFVFEALTGRDGRAVGYCDTERLD